MFFFWFRLDYFVVMLFAFVALGLIVATLHSRCGHYIFILWFLLLFYSPNLSGHRMDVYHTSTYGVATVQIYDAGLNHAARASLEMQGPKNHQKVAIWAPLHRFVELYLRN